RKENNLSRYELATRLGISESIISKYERNINLPSIEAALKICQLFKITSDYLLGNTNYSSYDKPLMDRVQAIQSIDKETKTKLYEIIDVYLRDANTKKFYQLNNIA
ncbi:MAG: helix-turn-helix transcriptional regulator, partial [Bacteroidetes bacterium]|nr:helix-turn-helix transcriptional regulator [Bacteroidota bacterium]